MQMAQARQGSVAQQVLACFAGLLPCWQHCSCSCAACTEMCTSPCNCAACQGLQHQSRRQPQLAHPEAISQAAMQAAELTGWTHILELQVAPGQD